MKANQLFQLTAANNAKLPISMYVELDLDFLGIVVQKRGGFDHPRTQQTFGDMS